MSLASKWQPIAQSAPLPPTIFDDVAERRVVFCVDASGSMHSKMPAVRAELSEALSRRCRGGGGGGGSFNVVRFGFGGVVERWSDGMVDCTEAAIVDVDRWLGGGVGAGCRGDDRQGGGEVYDALVVAASMLPDCQAICLVTDSLPLSSEVATEVVPPGLPVHCVYPMAEAESASATRTEPQPGLLAELQALAQATGGSLTVAQVGRRGCIERVAPVARAPASGWVRRRPPGVAQADNDLAARTAGWLVARDGSGGGGGGKLCSVTTALRCDPLLDAPALLFATQDGSVAWRNPADAAATAAGAAAPWSKFRVSRPAVRSVVERPTPQPPMAGFVGLVGRRVLARRRTDGKFYEGVVRSESSSGKFNVDLQLGADAGGFADTEYQSDTPAGELVALDDALRRPLLPGDCALAPRGPGRPDYGPALVLDGHERRRRWRPRLTEDDGDEEFERDDSDDKDNASERRPLAVAFTDGHSCSAVDPDRAVRISHELYHRLQLEATMPPRARLALAESRPDDYPEASAPGYPATKPLRDPTEFETVRPAWLPGRLLPEARYDRDGDCHDDQQDWYDEAYDRESADLKAERLIDEFHRRRSGAMTDVGVGTARKSILKKRPPPPPQQSSALQRRHGRSEQVQQRWRQHRIPSSTNWIAESGSASAAPASRRRTERGSSANLYNRRPPELGACLGLGDLALEERRRRADAARRSASAERIGALEARRADEAAADAARAAVARDRHWAREAASTAAASAAAVAQEQAFGQRRSRRQLGVSQGGVPDSGGGQERESRRRMVAPPAVADGDNQRPSRLRQVPPPARTEPDAGGRGGGLGLRRSVRFSSSEPTVAAWLRQQDAMNSEEVRSSAQKLAVRHRDCQAGLERQKWAATSAAKAVA